MSSDELLYLPIHSGEVVLKSLQLNDFHTGLQYFFILIYNIYKAFDESLEAVWKEMGGSYWNTGYQFNRLNVLSYFSKIKIDKTDNVRIT